MEKHEYDGRDTGWWCYYEYPNGKQCGRERDDGVHTMSLESDQATVMAAYPNAHLVTKTSSGGMKIVEHVIRSGVGDDDVTVGPQAFSEEKAWRYAAERLKRQGVWRE